MPTSMFSQTYIDESRESSTITFRVRDITAATIAAVLTEVATLGTAIGALSGGTLAKSQLIQDSSSFDASPPADPNAQRERKWLVRYQDTVNFKYGQVEIPVAEVSATLKVANSDRANLAATAWTDFITAFETTARSVDGNIVNVLEAILVGRNL